MNRIVFLYCTLLSLSQLTSAQNQEVSIWSTAIPHAIDNNNYKEQIEYDENQQPQRIRKVTSPTLTVFDDEEGVKVPCVIICPGGGYQHLSINKEGYTLAKWFNEQGVKAFVLKYRLPAKEISVNPEQAPLDDLTQAVSFIKENAERWNIDNENIGIMGFNAEGK